MFYQEQELASFLVLHIGLWRKFDEETAKFHCKNREAFFILK